MKKNISTMLFVALLMLVFSLPALAVEAYDPADSGELTVIPPNSSSQSTTAYQEIAFVDVTDMDAPASGEQPDTTGTASWDAFTIAAINWEPADAYYQQNTAYAVIINLEAKDGYQFSSAVDARVNNKDANIISGAGSQELRISYTFPKTKPDYDRITVTYDKTNVTATPGELVKLTLSTDLAIEMVNSDINFQWYKASSNHYGSGTAIPGATDYTYTVPTDKVGIAYYYCVVKAKVNSIPCTSEADDAAMVKVEVKDALPVITQQPQPVSIKPGENATFTAAASGTGLHYKWWYADAGMPFAFDIDSPTLTMTNVESGWNGFNLWCVVSNAAGEVTSSKALLTVSDSPYVFPFKDVTAGDWYYNDVLNANKLGLIDGKSAAAFNPADNLTYAEAIKLAVCMSIAYNGGDPKTVISPGVTSWYSPYVEFAKEHAIPCDFANYNAKITRAEYVYIFYYALPKDEYVQRNSISSLPDVKNGDKFSDEIFAFYRAGVLTGNDKLGTFNPNSNIKRSEVAAILSRMMDDSVRKTFTLEASR